MNRDATCGLFILVLDAVLGAALWAAVLLLRCSPSSLSLGTIWAFGAVKWVCLRAFASVVTDGNVPAVLGRLAALLCLLPPVMESGRVLTASPPETYSGPSPDLTALLLAPMAAALACVVWELGLSSGGKARRQKGDLDSRRLLFRMLKYFRPDTFHLIVAFASLILGVICDSYVPLYQGKVIDMLKGRELDPSYGHTLTQLVLIYIGSALFSGVRGGMFMCTLARLNKRLKHLLFHSLLQQEVQFFEENSPGRLCARLDTDVDRMGRTVALNANAAVRSTVKALLMLKLMLGLSWELTLLTCIEMPLLAIVQNKYSSLSRELKDQQQHCQARIKDQASQIIGGIQTVRSFKAEKAELRRYCEAVAQLSAVKRRSGVNSVVFVLIRRLMAVGLRTLMLVQARNLILSGRLSIGSLVSFLMYQKPMLNSMKEILYSFGDTVSTIGVISKVFGYFDRTPQCQPAGDLAPERLQGGIVFRDVTFSYPSAPDKPALKSVSVELAAGKITALVGPSGSGKTSFVSLLKRLYEPQEGQILLDGEPLHHYKHKYFHQRVTLVSQNPVLFTGSRRYNIEYGLQGCTEEKLRDAARKTNAVQLLSHVEDELDSDVGEGGAKLAGSQKKCIAVLRALVRDPQVVILDEATSKLDVDTQRAVLQGALSRGRTVLLVSHQLQTVEKADHIIYMENGAVVEEGTHQELMARRGRYYHQKEELFAQEGNL
ncbi:antigen peptide transporter 2 [Salarias fasciatus]|uniref:antigen peptide transporter 2 n=1 Tax=Salarias fasciatus TaxID=181472 RepID=UPI001176F526|nr:antigen peptide transporter 2-like [Salarias fasciatus]XP_029953449.1 antigen peptide transporter 2-like [Salarias fasciatus]